MKILVTGGAGYIGSFMTKALLDSGYNVIVVDNLQRDHREAVDLRAAFIKGDMLQKSFVQDFFNKEDIDAIFHFAGYISMGESMKNPGIYFENNVISALNILEEMKRKNIKKIIFSSTAGVYGNPVKIPISENQPRNPTNPYGESKKMVEQILSWYYSIHKISFASLRYFNAAGASLDGRLGENHCPETHIIPLAIEAALGKRDSFSLFGTDYNTQDGTAIRDYIHVLDLVDAHVLALKKLDAAEGEYFYNVGTGKGYSNKQVIDIVKKISGNDFVVKNENRRAGDAEVLIADPTRIKKELGFNPRYSDLETIVITAWEWRKSNAKFKMQSSK